jgi:regulatory protein
MDALTNAAMRALARREHSQQELRLKLQRHAPEALVECLLQQLREQGLQSDERFAEAYIRYRSARGYGPLRIKAELQERGVATETIQASLAEAAIDWLAIATKVRGKRFDISISKEYSERAKQMRFLQYRGFDQDQINAAMNLL